MNLRDFFRAMAVLTLLAGPAAAGEGISLQWDDCPPLGTDQKQFACDTNTGDPFSLILSVVPPEGITDFVGFVAVVDLDFQMKDVPPWWDFPGCRLGSDLEVTRATNYASCPEITDQPLFMGFAYDFAYGYPYRSRLRIAAAIDVELAHPLPATEPLTLCRVALSRRSTVGPSACAGCLVPACLSFRWVLLDAVSPESRRTVSSGSTIFALWQNAYPCPMVASPAVPHTWGQIKSLYR